MKEKRFRVLAVAAAAVVVSLLLGCSRFPIEYSIGRVDDRFNVSREDVISLSEDAANRWNKALGKEVLLYDPSARLKINLVYEERQANLDTLKSEVSGLNLTNSSIAGTKQQLDDMISEFESDLDKYNRDVEYWNSIGGAPKETHQTLQDRRRDLESRRNSLARAIQLFNSSIEKYNTDVESLRDKLKENEGKVEAQGVYKQPGNKIDIYTFGNRDELRLVLMHELGHALGSGHTKNSGSIMYRLIDEQNFEDPRPKKADVDAVEKGL
jgi:hypothetical protein